jgi:hypothetical protein
MDFFKVGKEAKEEMERGTGDFIPNFFLRKGRSAVITFLDGDLQDDSFMCPHYWIHEAKDSVGFFVKVPCIKGYTPFGGNCSLCDNTVGVSSFVCTFSVLHHNYTTKAGKEIPFLKSLYTVKKRVLTQLISYASKRKGLTGWVVEVSRSNDQKSPASGDMFDFVEKVNLKEFTRTHSVDTTPFIYKDAIKLYTPTEIEGMGILPNGTSEEEEVPDKAIPF